LNLRRVGQLNRFSLKRQVEAACQGDVEALGALYTHYYAKMCWIAYSVLLDYDLAEDAIQQSFANVCEKLDTLKSTRCFGSWLTTICRNTALQVHRDRRNKPPIEFVDRCKLGQCSDDGDQVNDLIKHAINSLAPLYREVIVLHYYEHMSYSEIGGLLGASKESVRARLYRARKTIEGYLNQKGYHKR
jgi:RNA polymerase sigma factor (sigma-70 family)